tara:strand:+ start:597 stop:1343 length:747 start_codon:yes stop_codon:yes gene_type:complete
MSYLNDYLVVIFAAGIGKRLGKLGKEKPKSLLKINKQALIDRLVLNLQEYGASKIFIMVGYKFNLIKKHIKSKNFKNIKFFKVDNFHKNGHALTWYKVKNFWKNKKQPLIFLHSDIVYDKKFLKNIIISKKKNIIGIKSKKNHKFKPDSLVVKVRSNIVQDIDFKKNIKSPEGEVIGINKFSSATTKNIFNYMKKFFNKKNKNISWELFLKKYIKEKKEKFYIIKNQKFDWININKIKDFNNAKKIGL